MSCQFQVSWERDYWDNLSICYFLYSDALKIDPFTLYNSRIKLPMKKGKLIVIRFHWCKQNHIFNFYQDW